MQRIAQPMKMWHSPTFLYYHFIILLSECFDAFFCVFVRVCHNFQTVLQRAKVSSPGYTRSFSNKGSSGIRCHYTPTIWHKFASAASLGERKKIIGLIIFHLFGILHSLFYTKSASMSPVTWEAALRLHRLTVAPWKKAPAIWRHHNASSATGAGDWTWPTEQRMSVCKVIAGSLTE